MTTVVAGVLGLGLSTLAVAPVGAQAAPASGDFVVVTADLEGQLFTSVLPFDVPFILTGAVPEGISTLEVRCWKLEVDPKTRQPRVRSRQDLASNPQDGACFAPLRWSNSIAPNVPAPTFRLLVPPLEAEENYQFKFSAEKKVTPEEAKAFAERIDRQLDTALWGTPQVGSEQPVSGDLTRAETPVLRAKLIDELRAASGADRVIEEGSVFNPDTPAEAVHGQFNALMAPVRNAQGKINQLAENYEDEITVLNPRLTALAGEPTLTRLAAALRTRAASDETFRPLATEVTSALVATPVPVLGSEDRNGADSLTAFVDQARADLAALGPGIRGLRDLLAGKPAGADGSLETQLAPLVTSGALTAEELNALRALGAPTGSVGAVDRAIPRVVQLLGQLESQLRARSTAVLALVEAFRTRAENSVVVAGNTTGSFATQSANYISADTGVLCAPELDDCSTYVGTNLYFRPVNKAAPLQQFGPFFSKASLARRVSVTVGLTVQGISDDGKTRDDLIGNQSLLLGLGARLSNSVRLTTGALLFKKVDPNPLVDDETLTTSWFLALSFDIDVAKSIQGIGTLFR